MAGARGNGWWTRPRWRGGIPRSSWCPGAASPPTLDLVRGRPGWDRISAVREGRVHEVDAATLLSPGPALLTGLRTVHELVQQALGDRD